jgi:hypothetical protein
MGWRGLFCCCCLAKSVFSFNSDAKNYYQDGYFYIFYHWSTAMKKRFGLRSAFGLWLVAASISLTACGGGTSDREPSPRVINYTPELRRFDIVDSYGVDTAQPGTTPLALSPYRDGGLFDVFWQVNSLEDYHVNIRINDSSGVTNSLSIHSEICGLGRACDQAGSVICEYTEDFYLSCNNSNYITDIAVLFPHDPPQKLYLMLEICDIDSAYCVYDSYPVWLE